MDVVLLSRMIGELMLDRDSLSLPGLGTFSAEEMPASFSDRGYTINPPYRRLSFSSAESKDGLLAGLYASSNGVSESEADSIIRSFAATVAEELRASKSVELPGLGRLRSTREGHLFFVASQDLDITPEATGLVSVSLKTHPAVSIADIAESSDAATTPQEVPPVTSASLHPSHCAALAGPSHSRGHGRPRFQETPPASVTAISEDSAEVKPKAVRKKLNPVVGWAIGAVAAVALVIGGFVALSRLAPEFTDRLLYTPEQLAIINAPEDGSCLPG